VWWSLTKEAEETVCVHYYVWSDTVVYVKYIAKYIEEKLFVGAAIGDDGCWGNCMCLVLCLIWCSCVC